MSTENIIASAPTIVEGVRTIEVITSEVIRLKADAGNAIIKIGERLIEAKEMLPHGKWLPWLTDQVEFSERSAQEFMKIAREWSNPRTLADYGKSKALKLLLLPPTEREEFVESHDVEAMSTRELKQAIKERDEARAEREKESERADSAEASRDDAEKRAHAAEEREKALLSDRDRDQEIWERQANSLREKIKELENRPVEVAVQIDEEAVQKAADEARAAAEAEWSAKVKEAEDKLAKAREKAEKAEEKAKKAGEQTNGEVANLKAEAEQLRAELEKAKREQAKASISGDADLAAFQLLFEAAQTDINKMRGLLLKVRGRENSELGEKLTAALLALAEKVKECAA